jgi:hypothetical protein
MDKSEQMALRFTQRAAKLRSFAQNVTDQESRKAMLEWAADYDRLAELAIELGTFSTCKAVAPTRRRQDICRQLGSDAT